MNATGRSTATTAEHASSRVLDMGEIWGRYGGDMGEIWGGVSSRALVGRHDSVFRDYAARRVHRRGRQGRRGPPPTPMAEIWPRYGRDMAEVWPRDGRDTFPAAARHISAPSRLPLGSFSTVSRGSSEQSRSNLGAISGDFAVSRGSSEQAPHTTLRHVRQWWRRRRREKRRRHSGQAATASSRCQLRQWWAGGGEWSDACA